MGSKLLIFTILSLLFGVQPVYANDPPILQNPSNTVTTTSSKLEWQAPSYQLFATNPYRIQVDDDSSFNTPAKDYPTDNTYYTPTLDPGTWYWKVKAKDSSGTWSDWSSIWSFNLTTPSPTPTSAPSSTPATSPSDSPSSSLFTISSVPSQINSDQSFTISANISSSGNFYCKGAFKKADGSNYFGFTKVSGNWIKNSSNFANQSPCSNNFNLEIKPDVDDSGYIGSGDYVFKIARYDADGGNLTWSNEITIKINNINIPSDSPAPQTTPKTSTSPSLVSLPKNSSSPGPKPNSSTTNDYRIASVAAAATTSAVFEGVKVINQNSTNPLIWIGLIFIFAGSCTIGYIYLKKNRHRLFH